MHKLLPALLALFSAASVAAETQADVPPRPQDFAFQIPLQIDGKDALYQTPLPLDVYRNTVRSDLGDLRVFNAEDEVVPHMLVNPATTSSGKSQNIKLNFFPLQGRGNEGLDQLSVRVRRNASGTLLSLDSAAAPRGKSRLSGYLLDTSAIKPPIQALELDWNGTSDGFVGTLQVESSNDLQHWRSVVNDAPLASLQYNGHRLLQKQVTFSPITSNYLRLSWPKEQQPLQLRGITAEIAPQTAEAPFSWASFSGNAVAEHPGEYQFDLGAHLPLQRLRFKLPQPNTLAEATLYSREKDTGKWQPVSHATLYQMQQAGRQLNNPDLRISSNHRYWLLKVAQENGGLGGGMPDLLAGWQVQQLQFLARGNAPFRLAYGSSRIAPAPAQIQTAMTGSEGGIGALEIRTAVAGTPGPMGSIANLAPPPAPLPWKKWLLWSLLVLAVLLLGWMAYRLLKQMERHDSGTT